MKIAMKPLAVACFLGVLGFLPAHAAESRIQLNGHFWAEGGFPPTFPGGQLNAVGTVNAVVAPLFWSPDTYSYTWYMTDLIAANISTWGQSHTIDYSGGQITIYVDVLPSNHDYGTYPTNATVPSTFTDSLANGRGVYLTGRILWAQLWYTTSTQTGNFQAELQFTDGNAFPQLQDAQGWSIGSTLSGVPGVSPLGYSGQINGTVLVDGPTSLRDSSWGAVKALYR
ncbi:hypothetical protein K8I85_18530 [bacterium]|nr:hypothetical protein [bacterium]